MPTKKAYHPNFEIHPVTAKQWSDLEMLFGDRGACGGCWCMWWRLNRSQFNSQRGRKNKKAFKKIIDSGEITGLLAYDQSKPIGWCSVAPRETFTVLERSRTLKRVDENPTWSIVCFFVAKPYRRKGITVKLIEAAVKFATDRGAKIIEGYPVETKKRSMPDVFAWTGFSSAFRTAGFIEVTRRSATRPFMRYFVADR